MSDSVTLRDYIDKRFEDSDKAIVAALAAQEKAVLKAENAAEERFKLLNELRGGVATIAQLEALEKAANELSNRLTRIEERGVGNQITKTNLYTAAGLAVAAITLVVLLVKSFVR